jgi:hypothetical protein
MEGMLCINILFLQDAWHVQRIVAVVSGFDAWYRAYVG